MLFIGAVLFGIYAGTSKLANEHKPVRTRWQYIYAAGKWIASIALLAFVLTGVLGGGCDSFDNCTEPSTAPQAETWAYFFLLILVPSMLGLRDGLKVSEKPYENTK